MPITNAILIYPENGTPAHRFCSESEAVAYLHQASDRFENASMLVAAGVEASFAFASSSLLRARVEQEKCQLAWGMKVKQALDDANVAFERDIRQKVQAAMAKLRPH